MTSGEAAKCSEHRTRDAARFRAESRIVRAALLAAAVNHPVAAVIDP